MAAPNVMGATPSPENGTKVVIEDGEDWLVVFSEELFHSAEADFEERVQANASSGRDHFGRMTMKVVRRSESRPDLIRLTPETFKDLGGGSILLERVLVISEDRTIQRVQFFVKPRRFVRANRWRGVADGIRESLRAGPRKLKTAPRTEEIEDLSIDIPAEHVLTSRWGADFMLYDIERISPYGTSGAWMRVYIGHESVDLPERATSVSGTLFGESVNWLRTSARNARFVQEILVRHPLRKQLYVHAIIYSDSLEELKFLQNTAETLRP